MFKLPKLYKRGSRDGLQEWEISVVEEDGYGKIIVRHGQVGGSIQELTDVVTKGKNAGKVNETSPYTQACAEAQSKWQKRVDKGYAEAPDGDLNKIKSRDERVAAGSIEPMLAEKWKDAKDDLDPNMEVLAQIKINGLRCVAKKNGKVELWTRGGKPIVTVPHIVAQLDSVMKPGDIWDGEICTEDCKPTSMMFQKIVGAVRKKAPNELSLGAVYHIFDSMTETHKAEGYLHRISVVIVAMENHDLRNVKIVASKTMTVSDVECYEKALTEQGYEGAIVRIPSAPYENKRTRNLLKVKTFIDEEFEIIDVEEGRGTRAGIAGRVICKMKDGKTFEAGISGSHEQSLELLQNKSKVIGKLCTVRYFTKTGDGKPQFPVFYGVREEE